MNCSTNFSENLSVNSVPRSSRMFKVRQESYYSKRRDEVIVEKSFVVYYFPDKLSDYKLYFF